MFDLSTDGYISKAEFKETLKMLLSPRKPEPVRVPVQLPSGAEGVRAATTEDLDLLIDFMIEVCYEKVIARAWDSVELTRSQFDTDNDNKLRFEDFQMYAESDARTEEFLSLCCKAFP